MKVYFISSPKSIATNREQNLSIYSTIEKLGHRHLTDFAISEVTDDFFTSDIREFCRQTVKDIKKADICIFETSMPSMEIGQLISTARQEYKPVIALFRDSNMPFFLSGFDDERIQLVDYTDGDLATKIKEAIDLLSGGNDTRFNFFVSPKLVQYLDWVSRTQRIPRSVYLRNLISTDKADNTEYNQLPQGEKL